MMWDMKGQKPRAVFCCIDNMLNNSCTFFLLLETYWLTVIVKNAKHTLPYSKNIEV